MMARYGHACRVLSGRFARTPAFSPLRHRNYRLLWSGLAVSQMGGWMQFTALGYLMLQLTGSPLYLGLLGLFQAVPRLSLAFLGGVLADRVDRRRLLLVTNALPMVSSFLLGILTATKHISPWTLLIIAAINSAVNAFDMPARQSLVPLLVGERELLQAISLNSIAFNGSGVFGPSLGGLFISLVGTAGCFIANGVSYLAVIAALVRMDPLPRVKKVQAGVLQDIREGLGLLLTNRVVLVLLAIVACQNFFGRPYVRMMPAIARDVLHVGPGGLGILMSAPGVGTIIGFFLLSYMSRAGAQKGLLLTTSSIYGLSVLLFALMTNFWIAVLVLVVVGLFQSTSQSTANTLLQLSVTEDARGRVMGLYGMMTFGMTTLGTLPVGAAAEAIGVGRAVAASGVLATLMVLVISLSSAEFRASAFPRVFTRPSAEA